MKLQSIFFTLIVLVEFVHPFDAAAQEPQSAQKLMFECKPTGSINNARYIGEYLGFENDIDAQNMAKDIYCADEFKKQSHPAGYVTIFGSSRIKEKYEKCKQDDDTCSDATNSENAKLYEKVMDFAYKWSKIYGEKYPIMTGAGPGLMEAGSRGAMKAIYEEINRPESVRRVIKSIGYTTYYDKPKEPAEYCISQRKKYCGDPSKAFTKARDGSEIITDGLIFSSVVTREAMMIKHSAAIILAPGGSGSEWEAFQILESIKSAQLNKVPVYLVGNKDVHWKTFYDRLDDMGRRGVIKRIKMGDGSYTNEVQQLFVHIEDPVEIIPQLARELGYIKVATWNMEWLANSPLTEIDRQKCLEEERQYKEIDKRPTHACRKGSPFRVNADYIRMAKHARAVDADIWALQEVEGDDAVQKIFDTNEYHIKTYPLGGWQKVGLAIRKSILKDGSNPVFKTFPDIGAPLTRDQRGAIEADIELKSKKLTISSIHLKSRCVSDPLDTNNEHCKPLNEQAKIAAMWIKNKSGGGYIVMGDFNRDLKNEKTPKLMPSFDLNSDPQRLPTFIPTATIVHPDGCYDKKFSPNLIEHIVFGGGVESGYVVNSVKSIQYVDTSLNLPITDHMLAKSLYSDHCVVTADYYVE